MDDVLQRMLEVEKEAAAIVREADAEAERIAAAGRAEVMTLEEQLERETLRETRRIVDERLAAAEASRQRLLAEAEADVRTRVAVFREKIAARRAAVVAELAYPAGVP